MHSIENLLGALRDLVAWLQSADTRSVIIGGVAASLLGRPRVTRDIDALVLLDSDQWQAFLTAGTRFGFGPRVSDALAFAQQRRVLLVRHQPSEIDADIVFAALPFEQEAIARAVVVEISDVRLPLPTPEDLVIMKAVAHRARDLADIESILDAHPKLNLRRVRRWVRDFSAALETPEILNDLETILGRQRKRKK